MSTVTRLNDHRGSKEERDFINKHPQPHRPKWNDLDNFRTEAEYRAELAARDKAK